MNQERGGNGPEPEDATDVTPSWASGSSGGWPAPADETPTQHIPRRSPPASSPTPVPASPTRSYRPVDPPPPASSYRPDHPARPDDSVWSAAGSWGEATQLPPTPPGGGHEAMNPTAAYGAGDPGLDPYGRLDAMAAHPGGDGGDQPPPGPPDLAGPAPAPVSPPRRRRRPRRLVAILAAVLVALLALFVVGDRIAVRAAEGEMAKQLKTSVMQTVPCGTAPPTVKDVSISGFPFLTQVLFGKFTNIGVTVENLPTPQLRIASVHANLKGIHVPFGQMVSNNVGEVPVDEVQAAVRIRYDDLNTFLADQPGMLQVIPVDGGRRVEISGTVDVPFFGTQQVGGITTFEVRDNQLTLIPTEITLRGLINAEIPLGMLGELIPSMPLPVGDLPFDLNVTEVSTDAAGLSLAATATDIVLPKADTPVQHC
ncbi:LmeA family phospholipid-binding protein [Frankia sp. CNm7]|uniref:LmeA family phospholipid-binding protein n=1 Tax=Frankia nepalensis TaxID=1836974 RepID=UPI001931F93B|nr:DUF2993 domain-containing protein [Frankia nepalensis]MBL7519562.1 LmeA family phospholipid-binding protein [Frankia nepalensis]